MFCVSSKYFPVLVRGLQVLLGVPGQVTIHEILGKEKTPPLETALERFGSSHRHYADTEQKLENGKGQTQRKGKRRSPLEKLKEWALSVLLFSASAISPPSMDSSMVSMASLSFLYDHTTAIEVLCTTCKGF